MRICIDARMMGAGNTRGIGRYIEELVRAMLELDTGHSFILLERDPSHSVFAHQRGVQHIRADVGWYGLEEQLRMPNILKKVSADIFHVPHWNVPVYSSLGRSPLVPRIVTIHDLLLLEEPESARATLRGPFVSAVKRFGYHMVLKNAIIRSQAILVPTQHVRDRIHAHFPNVKTPIVVVGEGMPDIDSSEWRDADNVKPYLLTVGSAYPHKNLDALLDTWKILEMTHPNLRLVLVGERDEFMKRTELRAKSLGLLQVEFVGRLSDIELRKTYARALALVFPSRWEGFGLPPLEAIAAGIPVLSSHTACMPEVIGKKGVIYFNPYSPDDIVRAVETLLRDPNSFRLSAREASKELRKRHDWHASAKRTLEAYESVRLKAGNEA